MRRERVYSSGTADVIYDEAVRDNALGNCSSELGEKRILNITRESSEILKLSEKSTKRRLISAAADSACDMNHPL